jgi:hypothetical protein
VERQAQKMNSLNVVTLAAGMSVVVAAAVVAAGVVGTRSYWLEPRGAVSEGTVHTIRAS